MIVNKIVKKLKKINGKKWLINVKNCKYNEKD